MAEDESSPPIPTIVPEYADAIRFKHVHGDPTLPQAAGLCGAIPIALEIMAFMFWLPTRAEFFAEAGIIVIAFSGFFFVVGSLFLLAHVILMSGPGKLRRLLSTSWVALLLLILNLPSAAGVIWIATR